MTGEEHERLGGLPGADLRKVRHVLVQDGRRLDVDVFEGRHAGLALVEIELPDAIDVPVPAVAGPGVTGDERFTGGWLAIASADALAATGRDGGLAPQPTPDRDAPGRTVSRSGQVLPDCVPCGRSPGLHRSPIIQAD